MEIEAERSGIRNQFKFSLLLNYEIRENSYFYKWNKTKWNKIYLQQFSRRSFQFFQLV